MTGPAGGAKCAEGGGVAAALGGDVTAEAEHVRPLAKSGVRVFEVRAEQAGRAAEVPARADEATDVRAVFRPGAGGSFGESAGVDAGVLGALGHVFGDVPGDMLLAELDAGEPSADDAYVGVPAGATVAPGQRPSFGTVGMRGSTQRGSLRGLGDDLGEMVGRDVTGRRHDRVRIGRVDAVQSDECVEVDDAAALVLTELGVPEF